MDTPKRTVLTRVMVAVAAVLAVLAMLWALAPQPATSPVAPPTPQLTLLAKYATGGSVRGVALSADGTPCPACGVMPDWHSDKKSRKERA